MKRCLNCNWYNTDEAKKCFNCGRNFPDNSNYSDTINFFNDNANLITIIAAISTIISLVPLFLTFFLGENWFSQLIGSSIGSNCLIVILIATFFSAILIYYLICLIIINSSKKIFKNRNVSFLDKVYTFVGIILLTAISGSLIFFLLYIWFTKFEPYSYLLGLNLLYLAMGPIFIFLIGIVYYICTTSKNDHKIECVSCISFFIFSLCAIVIILAALSSFFSLYTEMNLYHLSKNVDVGITPSQLNQTSAVPSLVLLTSKIDGLNPSTTVSIFDNYYAQCDWSTNYGYFLDVNAVDSVIKKQSNNLIIPSCNCSTDKIYWTYDIADHSKQKPIVLIGLNVEDPNKKNNNQLGNDHLIINWTTTDQIKIETGKYP